MSEHLSLIELIRKLLGGDSGLQAEFAKDPAKALESVGLGHIDAHDVQDALTLVHEDSPGPEHHGHDGGHDGPAPAPHHHESAAEYVNRYITNTFADHRSTDIDHSLHQDIDTHGGDFDQELDFHPVTASGDGAVAAGGDIRDSTVTTGSGNQVGADNLKGDGNVVGEGNQAVTGSHNTTGFGEGNVTSTSAGHDLNVGDGAAFASGGGATVDNSDNSAHHSFNETVDDSTNHSYNNESDNSVHDSGNQDVDTSSHHSGNTEVDTDIDHSYNDNSDSSFTVHAH